MEILSPAGNYQAAIAAFKGGSDAVYIGGKAFSARMSAENFSDEEIRDIIAYAHRIGRKVYVAMNTLLFQDEFLPAAAFAEQLYRYHADGIILQDLGLARYLHQRMPQLPLHASTQVNCHTLDQAKALKRIGFSRIVLARETDLAFAKQVKSLGIEVEVFVHGALCVSYSGNCLMSSFIGNRSGNRGRCAQPCRMEYRVSEDGTPVGDRNFALSTKDLMTLERMAELVSSGIDSLKIEGRLKQNEYVYAVSAAYRHAADACIGHRENPFDQSDREALKKIFSRKFTEGYLFGASKLGLLNQESSSHQGERIGTVEGARGTSVFIRLIRSVHRLDGIRFNDRRQYGRQIGRMYIGKDAPEEAASGDVIEIRCVENARSFLKAEVIRTTDYRLIRSVASALEKPLHVAVSAKLLTYVGKPLSLSVRFGAHRIDVRGDIVQAAEGNGTPKQRIAEQMKKSGKYPYRIEDLEIDGDQNIFLPIASCNRIRNEAFEQLARACEEACCPPLLPYKEEEFSFQARPYELRAVCETKAQAEELSRLKVTSFAYGDEENCRSYRIGPLRVSGKRTLIHSALEAFSVGGAVASPYCNITNSYALDCFFGLGFDECIASLELDERSLIAMREDFIRRHKRAPNLGIYAYGAIDMMILNSCPIGSFYSEKSVPCMRCHRARYALIDRIGATFPLMNDAPCQTRVLNAHPLYLLDCLERLKQNGIQAYLLFTDEDRDAVRDIVSAARSGAPWKGEPYTRGHFLKRVE